jgi:maltooligosyltrehalose trehalohydrolase
MTVVASPGQVWRPRLGAVPVPGGVRFHVWAPTRTAVDLVIDPGSPAERRLPLAKLADGTFEAVVHAMQPGTRYFYSPDGEGPFPDPCSRFQPAGVHGPSAVVDPGAFVWTDHRWRGVPLERAVFYELHVGTFTPEGTFAAATARLPYLADLGVSVVEIMPVADFPGTRNWGYDGASLFAPARCYGTPDDLRRLVDTAHSLGLAVVLDVVYNHFGPDGAYVFAFSPFYRSERHESPWGAAVNLDGPHSEDVRAFFIENALYWLHEFHVDGFRLDATHYFIDDSPVSFLAELTARVREAAPGRTVLVVAEDERNLDTIVRRPADAGWGADAVWADDFHHLVRRRVAGDRDGYYQAFSGSLADLATTIRQGWFFAGQFSSWARGPRGTDPHGVPVERMVVCIQNHDQVGNRAFGDRLHHTVPPEVYRTLSALLLFAPETPLLFMGQEWAASTPFQFFTDHNASLGPLVTAGRRAEFARFHQFADETTRTRIPDPQAVSTFDASRMDWREREEPMHAAVFRLYRALLHLRRDDPALTAGGRFDVEAIDDAGLALTRWSATGGVLLLVAWLGGSGTCELPALRHGEYEWDVVLSTEEPRFLVQPGEDGCAPRLARAGERPVLRFERPAAVILRPR